MRLLVVIVMLMVGLYGLAHVSEMMAFYADPKATVLQQISLRLNIGFIALGAILCICTLAVIDAIERSAVLPLSKSSEDRGSAVETPRIVNPSSDRKVAIAKALGVPVDGEGPERAP